MQHEFLTEILKKCKQEGIHTVLDTTVFCRPEIFRNVVQYADLVYADMKCIKADLHEKLTAVRNDWILENILYMDKNGYKFHIRMPIIPGYNDSDSIIEETIIFLKQLKSDFKVWLLPFHAYGKSKYERIGMKWTMKDMKNMDRTELEPIAEKFRKEQIEAEIQ